jgi:hypothetical protein
MGRQTGAQTSAAGGRRRSLYAVRTLDRSTGELAMERVVCLAWDFGDEVQMKRGWISYAARRMGLSPQIMSSILSGRYGARLGLKVIERIARHTGCTVGHLVDPD